MSFLGGAECSTAANPLSQFSKHVQDDSSLQRDRLVGRGPGGLQESMRSPGMAVPGSQEAMNEFMQQNAQLPQGPAAPFHMEQMRRELERSSQSPSPGAHGWAAEFDPGLQQVHHMHQAHSNSFSTADFARFQQMNGTPTEASQVNATPSNMSSFQRPFGMGYGGMMGGMGMMNGGYGGMMMQQPPAAMQAEDKGKARMVELDDKDWEQQFAELETVQKAEQERDLDKEANDAIEAQLNDMDRSVHPHPSSSEMTWKPAFGEDEDFESIWRKIQTETSNARQLVEDDDGVFDPTAMNEWANFDEPLSTHFPFDQSFGPYTFEEENPFRAVPNPFDEGVKIMREGGNLSLAALAFEAAVQQDPEHVEAWTKLGAAQAQNEKETPAIRALEQATKLDPNNLEALMGLAVSYTNEGYDSTAYRTLERWLAIKYPQLCTEPLSTPGEMGFTERHLLHEKITNLFIKAAQLSPQGVNMDPDVQVGLGVLFYGAEEFDKAVDCFGSALASTEAGTTNAADQKHLLWNRLGATLANSGRSEEAIDAYENALQLRPNFVRARYNLGVSCINIGCYAEAAQHLLGALAMHKVVEKEGRQKARELVGNSIDDRELDQLITQNQSTNLYDTLRRVFSQMDRRDLADRVGPGMDVDSFRGEFDF